MNNFCKKKYKKLMCNSLVMLVVFLCLVVNYQYVVKPQISRGKPLLVNTRGERKDVPNLSGGDIIKQSFELKDCQIEKFSLWINATNMKSEEKIYVQLKNLDTGKIVGKWNEEICADNGDGGITFFLEDRIKVIGKNKYEIEVVLDEDINPNEVTFKMSDWNAYAFGEMKKNEILQAGDLVFWIYDGPSFFLKYMFIAFSFFVIIGCSFLLKLKQEDFDATKIFVLLGSCIGILYLVFWSPFSAPDECRHYATAYKYSNILLGEEVKGENDEILIREEDLKFNNQEEFTRLSTYSLIFDDIFRKCESDKLIESGEKGLDISWVPYFPAILGITIARLLNLSSVGLLFCGRGFSLLFYLIIGYICIRLLPYRKKAMMCILLFPGIIQMGTSFSYDNMINSMFFLLFSYIIYLKDKNICIRIRDILLLSIILSVGAPIKFVYVFIGFLCIFLLGKNCREKLILCVPFIVAGVISVFQKIISISSALSGVNNSSAEVWTLEMVLENPIKCILICINTVIVSLENWIKEMVWGFPVYSGIEFPDILPWLFLVVLVVALLSEKTSLFFNKIEKMGIITVSVMIIGEIMGIFLLDPLTTIHSNTIGGIQGRYFLPCLPWWLFCVSDRIPVQDKCKIYIRFVPLTIFLLNIFTINTVFVTAIAR